jgi:hypothetical protein
VALTQFNRRLQALAKVPEQAARTAARAVEKAAKAEGAAVGPVHMGKRKRTVRLNAVSRFSGRGNQVTARVWGRPTGPWVWVTAGTATHTIPKPRRGRGKQRTTRYLKAAGYAHPIGRPIIHPGATGKGAWTRVRRQARTQAPAAYALAVRKAVRG